MNMMEAVENAGLGNCLKDIEDLKKVKVRFQVLLN